MWRWETALTTRDTNRVVRPLEWGFEWLPGGVEALADSPNDPLGAMVRLNERLTAESDGFFGYETPTDFRLETRHPQLFPTNVRPETLAQDADMKRKAAAGEMKTAEFLRFTSAVASPHAANDLVNARWFPASARQVEKFRKAGKPRQALIVMPQWNADGLSHNALCSIFNRFGVSCLRLSKPYHDVRRPAELERSDYAVSSNVGRTIAACRQAVADIRSCVDWLESQGYSQFGVMGTSLGSEYGYIAAAHDARLEVCAFNHASTSFGDVVWSGQSTRHLRAAFEAAGLTQANVRAALDCISPQAYMEKFAASPRKVLIVYAPYDLTFPVEYSLQAIENLKRFHVDHEVRVLPCGHYTTGETPYKYIDAWYLGSFVHRAYKEIGRRGQGSGREA